MNALTHFRQTLSRRTSPVLVAAAIVSGACGEPTPREPTHRTESAHEKAADAADVITNRLDVPQTVRDNLGIRFARAESRAVQRTLRLPGRFDLSASAVRAYPALLGGAVEPHVERLQRVTKGQLLATLRSPDLQERQHELHKVEHGVRRAVERLGVVTADLAALKSRMAFLQRRIKQLGAAGVHRAGLDGQLLAARGELPAATAQVSAAQAEIARERHHMRILLRSLADITGLSIAELTQTEVDPKHKHGGKDTHARGSRHESSPRWDRLSDLEIRARAGGLVTKIGVLAGAWAARGELMVEVTDASSLRFVATALHADVPRLVNGAAASVSGAGLSETAAATGTIVVGVAGSARTQTVPIAVNLERSPAWARAGLTGLAEVVVAGTSEPEIAVPLAAIVRDGVDDVLFRRDPADPDKVIRVVAELGPNDGRWVAVMSDVNVGDEIVVQGAYELKLAAGNKPTVKGHFHADGTFHAAEDE